MLYTSPWSRFKLTTSVVVGTDCIGSCKSNYHTSMAMTAPTPLLHHMYNCNSYKKADWSFSGSCFFFFFFFFEKEFCIFQRRSQWRHWISC
jgi:hypothetical protein